jgi:mannosyltransferase
MTPNKLKNPLQTWTRVPDAVWIATMIFIGWTVRLYHLGEQSLWFDEAYSWLSIAAADLRTSLSLTLATFVHPPLYYILSRPFMLLGDREWILRLPAAIAGILAIAAMYLLGKQVGGRRVGLLAALLLSVNPFHVWFSREVRNYTLAMLFAVLSVYFFVQVLHKGRGWIWFTLFSALGFLTHYFFLLIPLAQFSYFLLDFRQTYRLFRKWVLSMAMAFAPMTIWLIALFAQEEKLIGIAWIPTPKPWSLLNTVWNLSLLSVGRWTVLTTIALPVFVLAFALGLGRSCYRRWLILWLIVPPISIMLISWILQRSFYVDRYFIIILPAYLLLLALGVNRLPKSWAQTSLAVALLIGSSVATARIFVDPDLAKEDWRGALAVVREGRRPGDLVVVRDAESIVPLTYYYPEHLAPWTYLAPRSEADPWPTILEEYGPHRVWLVYGNSLNSSHTVTNGPPFDIYARADTATRNWLVAHREQIMEEHSLSGITVLLVDLERMSNGISNTVLFLEARPLPHLALARLAQAQGKTDTALAGYAQAAGPLSLEQKYPTVLYHRLGWPVPLPQVARIGYRQDVEAALEWGAMLEQRGGLVAAQQVYTAALTLDSYSDDVRQRLRGEDAYN